MKLLTINYKIMVSNGTKKPNTPVELNKIIASELNLKTLNTTKIIYINKHAKL